MFKFNWGTGIVIFFTLYAASMIFAVVSTTRFPPQLVQKDYYDLDLNYQARLVQKQNTVALSTPPTAIFNGVTKSIQVQLPEGVKAESGTAKCYRSVTTKDDFTTKFENTSALSIPTQGLAAGRWHVELVWETADGKSYFWEKALVVVP